ncbi:MAG TPA: sterol desaturase family protein [Caldimonas sp.]|jgi:sterol desaturase/sphingolipid hydroxylase (fatty acid hydroxylase superfamily)|nr:sterol desaturase family protein [Caldimonas sp.]HEX2542911.1 sterol desaturase family protein [Caldimonas sp.]
MGQRLRTAAPLLLAAGFIALLCWETRQPLRGPTRPRAGRLLRNLAVGAGGALVVAAIEAPVTRRVADIAERRQLGLVRQLGIGKPAQRVVSLLLLDYTLYLWHALMHRVPALWRWHRAHHADPDLDASTGLRFHAMEMLWSVPWRAAQAVLIGVPHSTMALWGRLTLAEVMFHHADVRLPPAAERVLSAFVVTPRLHGIHHSDVAAHQRTNLSAGLAVWDLLHGTRCTGVPQAGITIGVPVR